MYEVIKRSKVKSEIELKTVAEWNAEFPKSDILEPARNHTEVANWLVYLYGKGHYQYGIYISSELVDAGNLDNVVALKSVG